MEFLNTIPYPLITTAIFILGLSIGSFANVCIHRLPKKESVVFPVSHCTACSAPVRPFDNIPVISYLILGGKCRDCKKNISAIYPAIEVITGLLFLAGFIKFGLTFDFLTYTIIAPALVIITAIDIEDQIIPDAITLPGIVFGLAAGSYSIGYIDSILGFLLGGGLFYLLAVLSNGGMGGGDIKYIAAAGALVGWQKVLLIIFIGAFLGSFVGLFQIAVQKKTRKSLIPFGPFLAAATLITLFYGNLLIKLYMDSLAR
ncbi:MAG: prepilin peptidase [Nitrospinae bacterium]|nr:prepilin peptidase [Nitrospinota bacterium]